MRAVSRNADAQKGSKGEVKGNDEVEKADSESPQKRQEALRQSTRFTYSVEDRADEERKPRKSDSLGRDQNRETK